MLGQQKTFKSPIRLISPEKIAEMTAQDVVDILSCFSQSDIDSLGVRYLLIEKLFERAKEVAHDFSLHDIATIFNAIPKLKFSLLKYRYLILVLLEKVESGIDDLNGLDLDNIMQVFPVLGFDIVSHPGLLEKLIEKLRAKISKQPEDITLSSMINNVHVIAVALFVYQNAKKHPNTITILKEALLLVLKSLCDFNLKIITLEEYIKLKLVLDATTFLLPLNSQQSVIKNLSALLSRVRDISENALFSPVGDMVFDSLKASYMMKKNPKDFYGMHIGFPDKKIMIVINHPGQYFIDEKGVFQLNPQEQLCAELLKRNRWQIVRVSNIAVNLHAKKSDNGRLMNLLEPCLKPVKDSKDEDMRAVAIKKLNDYCDEINCGKAAIAKPVTYSFKLTTKMDEKKLSDHGVDLFEQGNEKDAYDVFNDVLKINPNNAATKHNLALLLYWGRGVMQNLIKAEQLAKEAYEAKLPEAKVLHYDICWTLHDCKGSSPVAVSSAVIKNPALNKGVVAQLMAGVDIRAEGLAFRDAGNAQKAQEYLAVAAAVETDSLLAVASQRGIPTNVNFP